jgi:hypothetical protein
MFTCYFASTPSGHLTIFYDLFWRRIQSKDWMVLLRWSWINPCIIVEYTQESKFLTCTRFTQWTCTRYNKYKQCPFVPFKIVHNVKYNCLWDAQSTLYSYATSINHTKFHLSKIVNSMYDKKIHLFFIYLHNDW